MVSEGATENMKKLLDNHGGELCMGGEVDIKKKWV